MTMKPIPPTDSDAKLRNLIREWKGDLSLPPRFQEGVWLRIEAENKAKAQSALQHFILSVQALFARPIFATACVTLFMAVGLSIGWVQAREQKARIDSSLSTRYVQSVDPYQSP